MLQPLYPGRKSPWYALNRRLGSPTTGLDGLEKSLWPLLEIKFWIVQAIVWSPYQLHYPGSVPFKVHITRPGRK
jgi:hypothetical protein